MSARARRIAAWAAAIAASLAVFALYTHPRTMVLVADFVWACFN